MLAPVEELESRIGYSFADRTLLLRALTHKSLLAETSDPDPRDNEQLEFLGDAILGYLASEFVLSLSPESNEGDLSRLKAHIVSAARLHEAALALELGPFLRLGKGEELSGGRAKKALLANAVEALIAAIYIDAGPDRGIEACRHFLTRYLWHSLADSGIPVDPKNALQELAQSRKLPIPRYSIVYETGPEHAKRFTVEARVGKQFTAQAEGSSKKAASQKAAELLLTVLRDSDCRAESPSGAGSQPARDS